MLLRFLWLLFLVNKCIAIAEYDFRSSIGEAIDKQILYLSPDALPFNSFAFVSNFVAAFTGTQCFGESISLFKLTNSPIINSSGTFYRNTVSRLVASPIYSTTSQASCNFSIVDANSALLLTSSAVPPMTQLYKTCNFTVVDRTPTIVGLNISVPLVYSASADGNILPSVNLCKNLSYAKVCKNDSVTYGVGGYYATWSTYTRANPYEDIQYPNINQLFYAFVNIDATTGGLVPNDPVADVWGYRALAKTKLSYPHIRTILSVGGWSFGTNLMSAYFTAVTNDSTKQSRFISELVSLVRKLGIDGVDIDWEWWADYKNSQAPVQSYYNLLYQIRSALNTAASQDNKYYNLTIAVPPTQPLIDALPNVIASGGSTPIMPNFWSSVGQIVDQVNVMAYGYLNGRSNTSYSFFQSNYNIPNASVINTFTGNQTNVTNSISKAVIESLSNALKRYEAYGIKKNQLAWGNALQVRTFQLTNVSTVFTGGLLQPITGVGMGDRQAGILDIKCMRNPVLNLRRGCSSTKVSPSALSSLIYFDQNSNSGLFDLVGRPAMQPWAYSPENNNMLTFDTPFSIALKSASIKSLGYKGLFFWALDGDMPEGPSSLMTAASYSLMKNS